MSSILRRRISATGQQAAMFMLLVNDQLSLFASVQIAQGLGFRIYTFSLTDP